MFYCFPGNYKSQKSKTPFLQARKMFVSFFKRKWPADKRNISVIVESILVIGSTIW